MKRLEPEIPLHDPSFPYVPAVKTDIRERFKRMGFKPPSERRAPVLPIRKVKP